MTRIVALAACILFGVAATPAAVQADTTINGISAQKYFETFLHKASDPKKPDEWCQTPLGEATAIPGTKRKVDVNLYLFKGGKFVAIYEDYEPGAASGGGTAMNDLKKKYIQGQWSVRGKELHLPGVGVASAKGKKMMSLKMTTEPGTKGVKGVSIILKYLGTSFGTYALRFQMKKAGVTPKF